jgi:hypothetical protein
MKNKFVCRHFRTLQAKKEAAFQVLFEMQLPIWCTARTQIRTESILDFIERYRPLTLMLSAMRLLTITAMDLPRAVSIKSKESSTQCMGGQA